MSRTRFGIVVFPGSNCDHDAYHALKHILGADVRFLWHKSNDLEDSDIIILPGGFSYGDYLRCGSIARFSPIMREVVRFAHRGGFVLGVCNGFQILTEAGLLPGALLRNSSLKFCCREVHLKVENSETPFTSAFVHGAIIRIPIAHGEGNYFTDDDTLKALEDNGQVVFRYCDDAGEASLGSNPNGSRNNIAGIVNAQGNVLGMMPHPERAVEALLGSTDGLGVFESLLQSIHQEIEIPA